MNTVQLLTPYHGIYDVRHAKTLARRPFGNVEASTGGVLLGIGHGGVLLRIVHASVHDDWIAVRAL